ncbi:hypothetical protein CKM354_000781000 [Cercospora kikuchii]|uniref:SnoaL-like domain-containing protein n=1 Tax=Cercospora kikuchii TaxID=84275 RepID=A0A9P3CNG1_9PEZI|nr:uncharacterized protein CKM354_000781000 [Cercospora kikuchii]GIZ44617.1 hypothetical protein CKM354_000781000 [Cercospora kikuchii]
MVLFTKAINSRDLSPTSPIWEFLGPGGIVHADGFLQDGPEKTLDVPEFLAMLRMIVDTYPEYAIHLQDMSTTLDAKGTRAVVHSNLDSHGMPKGVIKRIVTITTWRKIEGKWVVAEHVAIEGHAGDV